MKLWNFLGLFLIFGCCLVQTTDLDEEDDHSALTFLRRLVEKASKGENAIKPKASCPTLDEFQKLLKDKDVRKIPDKVCGAGQCSTDEDPLKDTYGVGWYCRCNGSNAGPFCQYEHPCDSSPCKDGEGCFPLRSEKLKYRNKGYLCFEYKRALRALENLNRDDQPDEAQNEIRLLMRTLWGKGVGSQDSSKYRAKDDPACPKDQECKFGACSTAEPDEGRSYHCYCGVGVGGKNCQKPDICDGKCKSAADGGTSCLALNTDKGYMCYDFKRFTRMLRFLENDVHKRHLDELMEVL